MLLPFTDSLIVTTHFDPEMAALADRHYSRRTVGARQFMVSGRKIVIRNTEGTLLFGWVWNYDGLRFDDQTGFCCAIFRNESARLSSDVIREAEEIALQKWGGHRMFTYVNAAKLRTRKKRGAEYCPWPPGRCFIEAGWKPAGMSKTGLHRLVKDECLSEEGKHNGSRTI